MHPGDVTSLHRRWPKALFQTMQKHLMDMERLRQHSRNRPEWEFRHNRPGFCSVPGTGRNCLEHPHDECSSRIGTVVAVPGGMVHCVKWLGE